MSTPDQALKFNSREKRIFQNARRLIYLAAALLILYGISKVIFSEQAFLLPIGQITHQENLITTPRDLSGNFIKSGRINPRTVAVLDISPREFFANADITVRLNKKSEDLLENNSLRIKRSFASFLSPVGSPLGFADGNLLKVADDYYLISSGKARKFSDKQTREKLNFTDSMFLSATKEELSASALGEAISDTSTYPEDTLFKSGDDEYYILKNGYLKKFISEQAFHSRFSDSQAMPLTSEIANNHPLNEEAWEGFADGSLLSYGQSVFIVSEEEILPVNNPETFLAFGYSWEDLLTVGGDEIGLYKKGKLFTPNAFHPNGTIFQNENNSFFRLADGKLHELPSSSVALSWSKRRPIMVSASQSQIASDCILRKNWRGLWQGNCSLKELASFSGKDFQFEFNFGDRDIKIDSLQINLRKDRSWESVKSAFANYKTQLKNRYVENL